MKPFLPFIIPIAFIVAGILLYQWGEDFISILLIVFPSVALFMAIIMAPIVRYDNQSKIIKFQETKQTIINIRQKGAEVEKAALVHKIIEANRWLASAKYWNKGIWDLYYPDEVMELEPLE